MDEFTEKLLRQMAEFGMGSALGDTVGEIDEFTAAGIAAGLANLTGNEDMSKEYKDIIEKLGVADRDSSGLVADIFSGMEAVDPMDFDFDSLKSDADFNFDDEDDDDDDDIENLSSIFKKK